ncbi:hypothetical protein Tco_1576227 [Tanacetum coccineum]
MRKKERVLMKEKYLAASQRMKSICNDEDDSIPLRDIIARYSPSVAITSSPPDLPTEEPEDSLIMGDEHLDTILENECDVPECDETSPTFTTFLNPLFDSNDDFTSSDDESLSDEDFDYLLEDFSGELAHIDPISPRIVDTEFEPEEEICLVENLSYDNSSPRPPEELNAEIADIIVESLSPFPIPVEDSDSHMEEIDLFLATDDSMPPGIENEDYDSEGDIRFPEELISNDSSPLPENESSNLDHFNDPSSSRPPMEPPDVEICLNFEPDTGVLTTKVVKGISEHYVLMPNILPTLPTLDPDLDFTPSHDPSDPKSRFLIQGYSLKSNPRDFYHGRNFLSHSFLILFIRCLTLCSRFHPKTRTQCSNLVQQKRSEVTGTRFKRRLKVMIGVRGWEYEVSRRLRGMLSLVDPAVKSWRTRSILMYAGKGKKVARVLMEEKYLAASQRIKSICNYDDDEDDSIPMRDIIARYSPSVAITSSPPVLPTREPEDSLIMGDEHLDTIPEKESDELIKSSVENLVPIPKLINNDSLLLPKNESSNLDHFNDPSPSRPPPEPPDVEICFDFKPDTGVVTNKVVPSSNLCWKVIIPSARLLRHQVPRVGNWTQLADFGHATWSGGTFDLATVTGGHRRWTVGFPAGWFGTGGPHGLIVIDHVDRFVVTTFDGGPVVKVPGDALAGHVAPLRDGFWHALNGVDPAVKKLAYVVHLLINMQVPRRYECSPKEVNAAGQHVNTASTEVNTGRFTLNTLDPSVNTVGSCDPDGPKDMFKLGASHTLKATHVEFFSDEDEPEVNLGNITNSYTVPTTPNVRIHKDHPIKNVIGDVKVPNYMQIAKALYDHLGNKKDERGIVIRNKARLVAQGHRQEEGFYGIANGLKSALFLEQLRKRFMLLQQQDLKIPDTFRKVYKVVQGHFMGCIRLQGMFWGTTTARTTDDGEVEITTSIDGQVKTVTETYLRRHFKLEDSDGITSLSNTEIFEQLALMGSDEATFISVDVDAGGAATTDIGLDAGQGSGTIHKTPTRPHDSPLLRVHTLGSDEGSLQQNELMDLVTKLTNRVEGFGDDMQQKGRFIVMLLQMLY